MYHLTKTIRVGLATLAVFGLLGWGLMAQSHLQAQAATTWVADGDPKPNTGG